MNWKPDCNVVFVKKGELTLVFKLNGQTLDDHFLADILEHFLKNDQPDAFIITREMQTQLRQNRINQYVIGLEHEVPIPTKSFDIPIIVQGGNHD